MALPEVTACSPSWSSNLLEARLARIGDTCLVMPGKFGIPEFMKGDGGLLLAFLAAESASLLPSAHC